MATGDRICPYCGHYQCICGKILRKALRNTFPGFNFPPEEPEPDGIKGKAIKPAWQVQAPSSIDDDQFVTIYAYDLNICEGCMAVVADGVKIEFPNPILGAERQS